MAEPPPQTPQTCIDNKYELIKPIGKGKFAVVHRAKRLADGDIVAVKKIAVDSMDAKAREKCLKEVRLLQSLSHQNIVQYLDSSIDGDELVIIFEWAAAGDLKRQVRKANERDKPFEERVIWKYFSQICDALSHMHSKRILHRDLKPANVFLTLDGTVKVGDLGLGRMMSEHTFEAHSKVGTPLYMSPEVLRGDGYDWKSDVWSLGCVLYELAVLKSPFKAEGLNLYSLFQKISKGEYAPPPEHYSATLRDLCVSMLRVDAKDRPDVASVTAVASRMRRETMSAAAAAKADAKRQQEYAEDKTLAEGWPVDQRSGTSGGRRPADARPPSSAGRRATPPADAEMRPPSSAGRRATPDTGRRATPDEVARPPSAAGHRRAAATPPAAHDERPATSGGRRPPSAAVFDEDQDAPVDHERRRRRVASETPFHEILAVSESAVERLYVLGYAQRRHERHEPPLVRTHFALQGAGTNLPSHVQWTDCCGACVFLIGVLGGSDRAVDEASPSQQATEILNRCAAVGFRGNARPPELARGFGEGASEVLEFLSRKALAQATLAPPDYSQVEKVETVDDEDESDGGVQEDCGDFVEELVLEDDYVVGEDAKFATADADDIDRAILQARTDAKAWAIELERVGPKLGLKTKVKDTWRRRIKLTHNSIERRHELNSVYAATTGTAQDARSACETLRRGEGVLDQRHHETKEALMCLRASLRELETQRDALQSGVSQKTDHLSTVMDKAEEAQAAVEGRGADLGDTRRLATVRSALKGLRAESQELELRLGVALAQTAAFARRGAPLLKDDASLSESSSS